MHGQWVFKLLGKLIECTSIHIVPFQIYFKFFLFNNISNEVWEHRDFAKENIKYPFHIKGAYYFKLNGLNCHFLHFTICGTKKIWCFCNKKWLHFSINIFFIIVSNFMPTATTVCHLKVRNSKREKREGI